MKRGVFLSEAREGLAVTAIVVVVVVFFMSVWIFKGPYFVHDIVTVMAPLEEMFGQIQRAGVSPLWSSDIHGGYPLLAFGQLGYYYFPHMVLRQFLNGVWVVQLSLAWHCLVAALGMYVFIRSQKLPASAGLLAGLVYAFGGALAARFAHVGMVLPLAWLPWSVLALHQIITTKAQWRLWLVMWVGANVWQAIAGHPQSALMGLLVQVVWFLVALLQRHVSRMVVVKLLGGSLLISGFLLPQVLPVVEIVPYTDRAGGLAAEEVLEFSAPPAAFWGLVLPHPFGRGSNYSGPKGEAELALYVGPIVVLLVFVALWRGSYQKRYRALLMTGLLLSVGGIVLGLGEHSIVYHWLATNTPQNFFSVPMRYLLLLHTGVILLASVGVSQLSLRWRRIALVAGLVPVLLVAWDWERELPVWSATQKPAVVSAVPKEARIWSQPGFIDPAPADNFGITVGSSVDRTRRYRQTMTSPFGIVEGVRVRLARPENVSSGTLQVVVTTQSGERVREAMVSGENIVDSEWTDIRFAPLSTSRQEPLTVELTSTWSAADAPKLFLHSNPGDTEFDPTGSLSMCRADRCEEVHTEEGATDAALAFIAPPDAAVLAHELLTPHAGVGYGVASGQWTGALPIVRVSHYLIQAKDSRILLDRLGISHLVTWSPPYRTLSAEMNWQEVASIPLQGGFVHLFRNTNAWPRWQFVSEVRGGVAAEDQLQTLMSLPTDSEAVISTAASGIFSTDGTIEVLQDKPTKLRLVTDHTVPSFLVVRDLLFPGWRATIDGKPTTISLTDALWRGLLVPSGQHEVTFTYQPSWVQPAGFGVSLAWVGLVVLVVGSRKPRTTGEQSAQRGEAVSH